MVALENSSAVPVRAVAPCVICGSDAWESRIELGEFCIRQCLKCGLGQTYPVPTQEQRSKVHEFVYTAEFMRRAYRVRHNELERRYVRQLRQIELLKMAPGMRLLDVGCSLGFFLSVARAQGYEAHGLEISAELADCAREQMSLGVFCGALEEARYPSKSFDVITLWDVLEHVPQPVGLLGEVHRVLRDDGILALQSPNMESAMARLAGKRWRWWLAPDHLHHFTPGSMIRLLGVCGFQIVEMQTWEPPRDLAADLLMSLLPWQPKSGSLCERVLRGSTYLTSQIVWPFVIPLQRSAWKQNQGALITVYAGKR